jgi:hypothetical protein
VETLPQLEVRAAKFSLWDLFQRSKPYQVILHGGNGVDYALEDPDHKTPRIPSTLSPTFNRYTAEAVAAKAGREFEAMNAETWAGRWGVPIDAIFTTQ